MMERHGRSDDEATPAGSVFGNLPSERPGRRSPRRRSTASAAPTEAPHEPGKPTAEPTRSAALPREPDPAADAEAVAAATAPSGSEHPEQAQERGGIEDLAWAGVAAAAEAATLGVRLASRAIERLRDGVDRR